MNLGCAVFDPVVVLRPEMVVCDPTARIDSFCKLEGGEGIFIGGLVHIASFCHLNIGGGTTTLEEGSACASGVRLISGSNVPGPGRGCSAVDPDAVIKRSFVHLKKNSIVFANSVILPGVTVGEGAVVAAGSVVRCDIPDGETWGGIPAKRLLPKANFANELDLAWAAGLIDGEGHIGVGRWQPKYVGVRGKRAGKLPPCTHMVRVSVEMTHEPTVRRLSEIFGGTVTTRQRQSRSGVGLYGRTWSWRVASRPVEPVLRALLPFLVTKRAEAEIALEIFDIPRYAHGKQALREDITQRLQALSGKEVPARKIGEVR